MNLQNNTFSKNKSFLKQGSIAKSLSGIAALALLSGATVGTAAAQDADNGDLEWEPDEGLHEEEWYDPSDWFDDLTETGDEIDVEDSWLDAYAYDGYAGTADDFNYDAYYDGYYDGYYDDSFGYDNWDATWESDYSAYYSQGYHDGHYDAQRNYAYDAYYYVYTTDSTAEGEESDRQRERDTDRERGDRQQKKQDSSASKNDSQREEVDRAEDLMAVHARIRGVVTSITLTGTESVRDDLHTTGEMRFANGTEVQVDFGPYVTSRNLPIKVGDLVTLIGRSVERENETMLRVTRVTHDGLTYRLAGPNRDLIRAEAEKSSSENRDSQR